MGLFGRLGLLLGNSALIIPVFILILISAILTSVASSKLQKKYNSEEISKWVKASTISLWSLFIGGLIIMFTMGVIVVTIPYLFNGGLIIFSLLNISIAGILFYAYNQIKKNPDYNEEDKSTLNLMLASGIIQIISGILLLIYSIYSIHKYRKGGGVTGDVALVGEYGGDIAMALGQPEIAIPLQTIGQAAKQNLNQNEQQELQQRITQANKIKTQIPPQLSQNFNITQPNPQNFSSSNSLQQQQFYKSVQPEVLGPFTKGQQPLTQPLNKQPLRQQPLRQQPLTQQPLNQQAQSNLSNNIGNIVSNVLSNPETISTAMKLLA